MNLYPVSRTHDVTGKGRQIREDIEIHREGQLAACIYILFHVPTTSLGRADRSERI